MNAKTHISVLITFFVLGSSLVVGQQNQNKDKKTPPPPIGFFITSTELRQRRRVSATWRGRPLFASGSRQPPERPGLAARHSMHT